jgi:hypothetical protein
LIVSGELLRRPVVAAFGLAAAIVLSGCADTRGGSIPYDRPLAAPDEQHFQVLPEDYKIAPMDTLTIKVFKADDLSGDYSVDLGGHISLPLVGQVEAANLTTAQLDSKLRELLGQKYFEHPDVSVAIAAARANGPTSALRHARHTAAAHQARKTSISAIPAMPAWTKR